MSKVTMEATLTSDVAKVWAVVTDLTAESFGRNQRIAQEHVSRYCVKYKGEFIEKLMLI